MDLSGDDIADVVLRKFDALPTKGKPLARGGGVKEWVPLSGIVAQGTNGPTCLVVATGMKCLPQEKVSRAQGIVLHDWHAETIAIRSFNRFLLDECHKLVSQKESSGFIRIRSEEERTGSHFQPFALKDSISLHMYCSEAPCGDASMELTMAAQNDSTPWTLPATTSDPTLSVSKPETATTMALDLPILHGRGFFSELGSVRRKPSRPDAPSTLSKSCSDKLSLKQCTSLLSSTTCLLISPSNIYISSLVLPKSQHSDIACKRAFSSEGRMKESSKKWDGEYQFKEPEIKTTSSEFKYSRRQVLAAGEKLVPSNISASWIASSSTLAKGNGRLEALIGGVLQGRKQHDIRGSSQVCKRNMWKLAMEVSTLVGIPQVEGCLTAATYAQVKSSDLLQWRSKVKDDVREKSLKGWVRNWGGDEFSIGSTTP